MATAEWLDAPQYWPLRPLFEMWGQGEIDRDGAEEVNVYIHQQYAALTEFGKNPDATRENLRDYSTERLWQAYDFLVCLGNMLETAPEMASDGNGVNPIERQRRIAGYEAGAKWVALLTKFVQMEAARRGTHLYSDFVGWGLKAPPDHARANWRVAFGTALLISSYCFSEAAWMFPGPVDSHA